MPASWVLLPFHVNLLPTCCTNRPALTPTVLYCPGLQGGQELCQLLPYKEGKLWVLLLVAAGVALTPHALGALQTAMEASAQPLAAQVRWMGLVR